MVAKPQQDGEEKRLRNKDQRASKEQGTDPPSLAATGCGDSAVPNSSRVAGRLGAGCRHQIGGSPGRTRATAEGPCSHRTQHFSKFSTWPASPHPFSCSISFSFNTFFPIYDPSL